ncbi:MAG: carbon-nitrogen hydrolase family protein [Gammaproteobacteria bacterium]
MTKLAIVQQPPAFLDKSRTVEHAVAYVEEAAGNGAHLVIFPEAFIPGYPAWIWRLRPGGDWGLTEEIHARLLENAVTLDGDDLAPLYEAARRHEVTILCGMDEREGGLSQATLYNTVVLIGADGRLLNRHRKLMPTNPERMVWGFGDASGLKVTETPAGRVGALICWENYMPLARYALYAQGIEIYVAPTYDSGAGWICSMQHIAREAGCWVVSSGNALTARDVPDDFPQKAVLYPDPDEWINPGDSVVIAPGGEIVAGPLRNEQAILYCEVDPQQVGIARRSLDVVGHYSRPDIFQLHVNTQPQTPVRFD